jgi:hypothetical protein
MKKLLLSLFILATLTPLTHAGIKLEKGWPTAQYHFKNKTDKIIKVMIYTESMIDIPCTHYDRQIDPGKAITIKTNCCIRKIDVGEVGQKRKKVWESEFFGKRCFGLTFEITQDKHGKFKANIK